MLSGGANSRGASICGERPQKRQWCPNHSRIIPATLKMERLRNEPNCKEFPLLAECKEVDPRTLESGSHAAGLQRINLSTSAIRSGRNYLKTEPEDLSLILGFRR